MSTVSAGRDGRQASLSWRSLAVFAGGIEHLDAALEGAVTPVVRRRQEQGSLTRWYFSRWVDQRGPHLRVALAGGDAAPVDAEIAELLSGAVAGDKGSERAPVMPPPVSRRRGTRHVGVEAAEHRPEQERFGTGLGDAEELFEVSSDVVLRALPALPRGRERVAFGLSLMLALSELGLSAQERPTFWDDVAMRWTGTGEAGRKVLDRLAGHARDLGPLLAADARRLGGEGDLAAGLEHYTGACERMLAATDAAGAADLVRHHTHLTNNRLGVNPLEEVLLASVLAGGLDRSTQQPKRTGAVEPAAAPEPASAPADPSGETIRVEEVSKDVGGHRVLDGVSFTVGEGEVFGIVGPNGAGKSSLLGVAGGLRVVSEGTVRVLGADPVVDRRELVGEAATALPDDELAPQRSVRENLELRARPQDGTTADEVLGLIGLRDRSSVAVVDLRRGEQRRLAIGCALMSGPRIVFLDEPTGDLSAVEREEVWHVVQRLRERSSTVILASTSVQEMLSACDRAALILAGTLIDLGEPQELAEHHFSPRSVHFSTAEEPDVALLQDLPEVSDVRVEQRADHWALEVTALQPDELLKVIGNDPEFPEISSIAVEDLEATFLMHARAQDGEN